MSLRNGRKIVADGLESDQVVCLVCAKMFPAPINCGSSDSDPLKDQRNNTLKRKQTLAEITCIDTGLLFINDDRRSFCQSCGIKVNQLFEVSLKFLHLRNELIGMSTDLSHSVVQTNGRLLLKANDDFSDSFHEPRFDEWNSQRINRMLLNNLQSHQAGTDSGSAVTEKENKYENRNGPNNADLVSISDSVDIEDPSLLSLKIQPLQCSSSVGLDLERLMENDGDIGSLGGIESPALSSPTIYCRDLDDHPNKTTPNPIADLRNFICTSCNEVFSDRTALNIHMRSHKRPGKEPLSCKECNKKFNSTKTLKAHERIHTENVKVLLTCPICKKTMAQKRSLDAHLYRHHTEDFNLSNASCEVCHKTFESVYKLVGHMNVHRGDFLCPVPTCKKAFKTHSHLEKHNESHHAGLLVLDCDFCMSYFEDKASLEEHQKTHSFLQAFLCDHCGKSFSSKPLLLTHLRLHKNVEFRCEICDKSFFSSSNLKNHQRLHTGERPFQCSECSQTFVQKTSLNLHMRKHSGVSPFTCTYCKHPGFSYKLAYRQHLASKHPEIYLETKRFLCNTCWKNFNQESDLREHEVLHEKHKCRLCNRQFKMLVHLKEHLLRHASLKPHKCTICPDKAFLRRKTLIDHFKRSHPDEDVEAATEGENNITYIVHITS